MVNTPPFRRLRRNQVQALLEPSAKTVRSQYINILTLLQDLLGRYGSSGNATVFDDPREAEHLISEALIVITRLSSESESLVSGTQELRSQTRSIKLRVDYVRAARSIGVVSHHDIAHLLKPLGWKQTGLGPTSAQGGFIRVGVNDSSRLLQIGKRCYRIAKFSFRDFAEATGAAPKDFAEAARAYDNLMKQMVGDRRFELPLEGKGGSLAENSMNLRSAVLDCASTNVATAYALNQIFQKQLRSSNSRRVSTKVIKTIDEFLEAALEEYQLLRKPTLSGSAPPIAGKSAARQTESGLSISSK